MTNLMRHPYRVPRVEKPRAEGRFYLPTGRRLGFAEFGDPSGDPVLWFHGTPGGRRQFPLLGRRAAEKMGLRVVAVGRPGTGLSDPHPYESVADWASDVTHIADALGAERLGVAGLSGGGPYALACAAVPPLASRVAAVAVLGGIVPSVDPDALATGAIELARRFAPVRWWHGDADNIVPLRDAQAAVDLLPHAELVLRHQESHLGGFATADEVLGFLRSHL